MLCEHCKGKGQAPLVDSAIQHKKGPCGACNGTGRKGRFVKIKGTGECAQNFTKKHRFIMISFPNPEYWGDRIKEAFYEFMCWHCGKKVEVPYEEAQKEEISV